MKLALVLLAFIVFAGCASSTNPTATSPEPTAPVLHPKQLVSKEGNNPACTDVLVNPVQVPFTVEEGYDQIEVSFHMSGVGQVGYEIKAPDGSVIVAQEDKAPDEKQPCSHAHEGNVATFDVQAGTFTATVRNVGVVGWHLLVNEKSSKSNETGGHHEP